MQKLAGLQQNMETSRASRLEQEVKRLEEEVKRLEELAQKLTLENRKLENNLADLSDASDQVNIPHVAQTSHVYTRYTKNARRTKLQVDRCRYKEIHEKYFVYNYF